MRRFSNLEPMRLLAAALAVAFGLLAAGFAVGAATGSLSWEGAVSAGLAVLIVAAGLLYAWRLGAPSRRR